MNSENIKKDQVVSNNKSKQTTQQEIFQRTIEMKYHVKFETYWEFHKWSVENYTKFLEELWNYFKVISSQPYKEVLVKTGPGFLDNKWFNGAKLNYAENILRINNDKTALICVDEKGGEEYVTFSKLQEEVKLYAAAFRKNGLKIGDVVACYMSNRKEAVFAMLAATSIGAMWGGPLPYYGAKAASDVIKVLDAKFLITVDEFQDNGIVYPLLDNLPPIIESTPTLKKVLLVVTNEDTRKKGISKIPHCVYLEDFLEDARTPDGQVPDIIFEQLSFSHPQFINFTSGTTGLPKASVHSVGCFIPFLLDATFQYDLKEGGRIFSAFPNGWVVWDLFVPYLSLGITLILFNGSILHTKDGFNFWDQLAKYNVTMVPCSPGYLDRMEKMNIFPSSGTDLSCLKIFQILAAPVKMNNLEYVCSIKKDVFQAIYYSATEIFGCVLGSNMNMPRHNTEIQVPMLGVDLQCFNSEGKSVIGEKGELVICTPNMNFPIGLWKDVDKTRLTITYLSKFPGVWAQHDEGWINPETKGVIVIGRSDDTLMQEGERFGANDIYAAIHSLKELQDYICVSQRKNNGDCRAVLFVKMSQGFKLTPAIRTKIEQRIDKELWMDCVPQLILEIPDVPYNLNRKKMESLVRKIIETNQIPEVRNIRNRECLKHYLNIPEVIKYYED